MPIARPEILKDGPTLDITQQLSLIKLFTTDDVEQALKSIDDSKAL